MGYETNLNSEQQHDITSDDLINYLLIQYLHEDKTDTEVLAYLCSEGMQKDEADKLIIMVKQIIYKAKKPIAFRYLFLGAILALTGSATIISFFYKKPNSFSVILAMGMLVFGIMKFIESLNTLKAIAKFENSGRLFKSFKWKDIFNNLITLESRYRKSNADD